MDFEAIQTSIVAFVRQNQSWAPYIVAGLAFGESVAFLSLFVPATVILIAISALIGVADLEFWPLWLGAVTGAATGDVVSYALGRRYKMSIYRVWPLSTHPQLVDKGERFFCRHGLWGVFIGRFFGPARAVVPLVAGAFGMQLPLFMMGNLASAFFWAFALLAPGAGLSEYLGWEPNVPPQWIGSSLRVQSALRTAATLTMPSRPVVAISVTSPDSDTLTVEVMSLSGK